ncbi:MAG: TonB-dependent receptor plug domain-containing protein [Spirochaetia bacterium]
MRFLLLFIALNFCWVHTLVAQSAESEEEILETGEAGETKAELQVVATKSPKRISDTAADVVVINEKDLAATGASSVAEVLRSAGIAALDTTSTEKGAAIYLRGLSIDYMLVIIDGQRVMNGSVSLRNLPISSIERIEIVKGPSSYLWGADAVAGVIYIQTKRGAKEKGFRGSTGITYSHDFEASPNNYRVRPFLDFSYGTGSASFYTGGSFDYGYHWVSDYAIKAGAIVMNERRDHGNFNVYGGTKIEFADIHEIAVNLTYDNRMSPFMDEEKMYEGISTLFHPSWNTAGNIVYRVFPLDNLDIIASTGINYEENDRMFSRAPGDFDKERFISNNTELMTIYGINDNFTFKGGFAFEYQRRSQAEENPIDNKHFNQLNNALFFGGDYALRGLGVDVDVTLGARYQYNIRHATEGTGYGGNMEKAKDLHSFSPELGIVVKPIKTVAIKAHVGHAFKAPDLERTFRKDRAVTSSGYSIGGNPNLGPESSWGYSGTIEYIPIPALFLSASLYRNDLWGMIAFRETGEIFDGLPMRRPFNIGRAYTWGVSAIIAGSFDIDHFGTLTPSLNFDWVNAREIRTSITGNYVDESGRFINNPHLQDRPPIILTGSLSWSRADWGTSVKFSGYYFHNAYHYDYNTTIDVYTQKRSGPQTTFDIRIAQKIQVDPSAKTPVESTLFFEAKNLLNAKYDSDFDGDTDQQGVNFVIGFMLNF